MTPALKHKYEVDIEVMAKPKSEYMTDEYFELDLAVALTIIVDNEIVTEESDVSQNAI
jgi:hypothetical protein